MKENKESVISAEMNCAPFLINTSYILHNFLLKNICKKSKKIVDNCQQI